MTPTIIHVTEDLHGHSVDDILSLIWSRLRDAGFIAAADTMSHGAIVSVSRGTLRELATEQARGCFDLSKLHVVREALASAGVYLRAPVPVEGPRKPGRWVELDCPLMPGESLTIFAAARYVHVGLSREQTDCTKAAAIRAALAAGVLTDAEAKAKTDGLHISTTAREITSDFRITEAVARLRAKLDEVGDA